jgi:hypothetical protein
MKIIEEKWKSSDANEDMDLQQVSMIKQFKEVWNNLPSPDAVEQIYYGHLFPFLANLWGNGGLNKDEAAPFFTIFEHSQFFARKNMSEKALSFRKQAAEVGLIDSDTGKPFAVDVIETYLNYGFDYVLLGMKKVEYVKQVQHLFYT